MVLKNLAVRTGLPMVALGALLVAATRTTSPPASPSTGKVDRDATAAPVVHPRAGVGTPTPLKRLEQQIESFATSIPGSVGVAVKHLESGQEVTVLPDEPFPMASTFKVAVLVEALTQVRQGKLSLEEEVGLAPGHQHLGSGILAHFVAPGAKLSVRNLMQLMMMISDNSATDLLLGRVGAANVNATLARAGIGGMRVDRSCQQLILDYVGLDAVRFEDKSRDAISDVLDDRAWNDSRTREAHVRYYYDRRDSATPVAMNRLLEQIFRAEILPREDCDLILEVMKRCRTGSNRLPGLLPPGTALAHKTGTVGTTVNDVGILYLPDGLGHVAVSVFTKDPANDNPMFDRSRAERVIAHIARAAYDFFCFTAGAPVAGVEGARPPLARAKVAADAIYVNGKIYTVDAASSVVEALAIKAGRILAAGDSRELSTAYRGADTRMIDLHGSTVVPGLTDAHGHFESLGEVKLELDLVATTSYEEAIKQVKDRARRLEPGAWIVGRRWDQANWGLKDFPTNRWLSQAVPDHPVYLTRVDGHAALVNDKALQLAGVTDSTPDPPGGDILRSSDGRATGVLVDSAADLVSRVIQRKQLPLSELAAAAQAACFRAGLTTVHDAGVAAAEIPAWKQLYDSGALKIRLYVMLSGGPGIVDYFARHRPLIGYADNRFTVRSCKLFVDGAMGSRGAWMLQPYSDKPVNDEGQPYTGLVLTAPEDIRRIAAAGLEYGYQICTHAIGDRGNREVLDAYEAALRDAGATTGLPGDAAQPSGAVDHRFRIEHAQCVALSDIARFALLGVIPSMQQTHATSDMRWAEDRVGPQRILGCYAWRRFYEAGCRIAGGSDFPVEDERPLLGFYAGITRQNVQGEPTGGWYADQRQTREEALRSLTIDAAYAAFEEDVKGSLEPGKLADFVVLDRDIMEVPPPEILQTAVLQTVVGGEVVYEGR